MKLRDAAVFFLATGFYIGKIPFAPGTFGSIVGLPICFALATIKLPLAAIFVLFFIFLAIWIANAAEKVIKRNDPGCIVIDEIAGMVVTLFGLPLNLITILAGFMIFRILDILKPFPIRALDKKISGGIGVVADDVVAGIIANFLLRMIDYIF